MGQNESGSGYRVEVKGQLLCVRAWGAFDTELFSKYQAEALPLQQQLKGAGWGVLLQLQGEIVVDYDLARLLMASVAEGKKIGRKATAVVMADCIPHVELVEGILTKVYRRAGEPCAFFTDAQSAAVWLQEQLDSV